MTKTQQRRGPALVVCRDGAPVPTELRGAVVAIGNFDGLHLGHQRLIGEAMSQAHGQARPSAILTFDPHPRAFFAPDVPHFRLTPEPVKLKILDRLGLDAAFIRRFDAELARTSARDFVEGLVGRDLGASALVVGDDFHFGRGREGTPEVMRALAAAAGMRLTVVSMVENGDVPVSSSRIREALAAGNVALANTLLGYRWIVMGEVQHGAKLGRTLGYPTANLGLDPGCRLAHGIYAVRVATPDGVVRDGVASFGRRPTFDDGAPLLETYVFDFVGDLYGRQIEVEFVGWIRGEERFASADDLVMQMGRDEEEARSILARPAVPGPVSLIGGAAAPYTVPTVDTGSEPPDLEQAVPVAGRD